MTQTPAAPAANTSDNLFRVMPPMAYTGMDAALTDARNNASPRGGMPRLQSVA